MLLCCQLVSARTVKVGYFRDSPPFMCGKDESEPKNGYAYEYLQKIASYTGWEYEYVYGDWGELYPMLVKGDIDILPAVSYSAQRKTEVNFPLYSMGDETYYLYCQASRKEMIAGKPETIEGKTINLGTGTYHTELLRQWLKENNVHLNITEDYFYDVLEDDFNKGKYDLFLSMDNVAEPGWEPLFRIGKSEIYLAVAKGAPDILEELDIAQSRLFTLFPNYSSLLWTKWYKTSSVSKRLANYEADWFGRHQKITIGILRDDSPFCFMNEKTGEAEGLVTFIIKNLKDTYNVTSEIEYKFYDTFSDLFLALAEKEVTAIFPAIIDYANAEKNGFIVSDPFVSNTVGCFYKRNQELTDKRKVAVIGGQHADYHMVRYYPEYEITRCKTVDECMTLLARNKVTYAAFNMHKINDYLISRHKYSKFNILELPEHCDLRFCVNREDKDFANTMSKLSYTISNEKLNSEVTRLCLQIQKYTTQNFLEDYLWIIIFVAGIIILLSAALVFANDKIKMLVNYDVLTHLLNRRVLNKNLDCCIKHSKFTEEKFCIILYDIDNFKKINDNYGHSAGDRVLEVAAGIFSKGIKQKDSAFRWDGEEFLLIVKTDKDTAIHIAERIRQEIESQCVEYEGQNIKFTVSAGLAEYSNGMDTKELFSKVDANLYKSKNSGKNRVTY